MASKAEQKQTGFRSIFASLIAPTCLISYSQKFYFSVKKGTTLLDVVFFSLRGGGGGDKNIRFGSLTLRL